MIEATFYPSSTQKHTYDDDDDDVSPRANDKRTNILSIYLCTVRALMRRRDMTFYRVRASRTISIFFKHAKCIHAVDM